MKNVGNSSRGRSQGVMKISRAPCIGRIALSSLRWHSFLVIILSLSHSEMNCRNSWGKIFHLTSSLLLHYLAKIECSAAHSLIITQNNVYTSNTEMGQVQHRGLVQVQVQVPLPYNPVQVQVGPYANLNLKKNLHSETIILKKTITSRVTVNFLLKFSNFRCHGNRGWSGTNFASPVKFADPDNPLLGPGMEVVSPIQTELLPIFC